MPEPPSTSPTAEETALRADAQLENAKTRALRDSLLATRNCPRCSFPVINWKSHCYVCHLELGKIKLRPDKT